MSSHSYVKSVLTVIAVCLVLLVAQGWAEPRSLHALTSAPAAVPQGGPAGPMEVVIVGLRLNDGAGALPVTLGGELLPVSLSTVGQTKAAELLVDVPTADGTGIAGPGFRVLQVPAK